MIALGRRCFGPLYDGAQLQRNWRFGPGAAFFGIYEGDTLVAFNGFLVLPGERAGRPVRLVESCHSATAPEHRGEGLFSKLILLGKSELKADWLVGFGNANSAPIMTKRLGFRSIPAARAYLPATAVERWFRPMTPDPLAVVADEAAIAAWKEAESPGQIVRASAGKAFVWGRVGRRRLGPLSLRAFRVGGWSVEGAGDLASAIRHIGCSTVEIVAPVTAQAVRSARWSFGSRSEAFNWLPNSETESEPAFDLYAGIKDNW